MTLREVGENLGLTRERVRQLESQALLKLMASLGGSPVSDPWTGRSITAAGRVLARSHRPPLFRPAPPSHPAGPAPVDPAAAPAPPLACRTRASPPENNA